MASLTLDLVTSQDNYDQLERLAQGKTGSNISTCLRDSLSGMACHEAQ